VRPRNIVVPRRQAKNALHYLAQIISTISGQDDPLMSPTPATDLAPPNSYADNLATYGEQAEGAFERNTTRAMLSDQRLFGAYCDKVGATAMPAAPATVTGFIRAMAEAGRKPASIRRYLATIAHVHRAARAGPDQGQRRDARHADDAQAKGALPVAGRAVQARAR
jgi:hypothetical protein